MPDNEKKTLKIKTTVRQAADKIKNSESAEKALHTVNDLADKTKSTTKDLTEKIKSSETVEKLSNNETVSKAKSAVSDVAEKVVNSEAGEKAKELVDSVKSKNIKANRIIKIGAIALILIIILGAFIPNIGFDKKDAEYQLEQHILTFGSVIPDSIKVDCIDTYKGEPTSAAGNNKFTGKVYILDVHYTIQDVTYGDIEYNYVYGGYEKEDGSYLFSTLAGYKNSNGDPDNNYSSRNKAKKELMKTLKKVVK